MSQPVFLIDASIYIFRAYFAIPDEWYSPKGDSVNALYGYTSFLLRFLQNSRPKAIAAAYDESLGSCFRNSIYPEYKSSRALPDDALALQLEACKGLTEIFGIASLASERYEADDIIATLATEAQGRGEAVCVVTRDKDLGQLIVGADDYLWDPAGDQRVDRENFVDHFGVRPEQMTDFLALMGDSVDDIPGVPGIGKKTAARLLQLFGDIETLYGDLDAVAACGIRGAKGIVSKLAEHREQVAMAQQLVALYREVPLSVSSSNLQWQPPSQETVSGYLEEFGLAQRFERQLSQCYWWK